MQSGNLSRVSPDVSQDSEVSLARREQVVRFPALRGPVLSALCASEPHSEQSQGRL